MKQKLQDIKIGTKMFITFSIIVLLTVLMGIFAITNIHNINEADDRLYQNNTVGMSYASIADVSFQQIRTVYVRMVYEANKDTVNTYEANYKELLKTVAENLELYDKTAQIDRDREILSRVLPLWETYQELFDNTIDSLKNGTDRMSITDINEASVVSDELSLVFDELIDFNVGQGKVLADSNQELADNSVRVMIIIMIVSILCAILIGTFLVNILSAPLKKMVLAADRVALGDVNITSQTDRKDEIGDLDKALSRMVDNIRNQAEMAEHIAEGDYTIDVKVLGELDVLGKALYKIVENNNQLVSNIAASSENVFVSAKQISDSSIILSEGSTEQASSVEELTASLEEISAQTQINADNARKANDLADTAKEQAVQGNHQMKDMLKSMEDINEASTNINRIIKVIDDIAFQTNILALNAAVEAARAGQHGKGFAVVAEEVKNLSARSANAAKETTELIESSIKKTDVGRQLANDAAEALKKIVNSVEEVSTIIQDITIASTEQAQGVEQINQGIMQVSHVVQNNSATSEENAAASEELSSQAESLRNMIRQFKTKKTAANQFQKSVEEYNPQIFQMIDHMGDTKKKKPQIILQDNEFGKY